MKYRVNLFFIKSSFNFTLKKFFFEGYKIRAFVRSENKIPDHLHDKVEPFVGDVTNAEKVSEAISDMEGVVVVLGTRDEISTYFY
jgi:uncharacterized protein YbjT (DUF2867 family)